MRQLLPTPPVEANKERLNQQMDIASAVFGERQKHLLRGNIPAPRTTILYSRLVPRELIVCAGTDDYRVSPNLMFLLFNEGYLCCIAAIRYREESCGALKKSDGGFDEPAGGFEGELVLMIIVLVTVETMIGALSCLGGIVESISAVRLDVDRESNAGGKRTSRWVAGEVMKGNGPVTSRGADGV